MSSEPSDFNSIALLQENASNLAADGSTLEQPEHAGAATPTRTGRTASSDTGPPVPQRLDTATNETPAPASISSVALAAAKDTKEVQPAIRQSAIEAVDPSVAAPRQPVPFAAWTSAEPVCSHPEVLDVDLDLGPGGLEAESAEVWGSAYDELDDQPIENCSQVHLSQRLHFGLGSPVDRRSCAVVGRQQDPDGAGTG